MTNPKRPPILSIAGFDPTGGAGIIADATVFRAFGFHPLTVLTSVAAQGAANVSEVLPLPKTFIAKELAIIASEFQPQAVKIGMLYSSDAVEATADYLNTQTLPVVLDPLVKSSSGGDLALPTAIPTIEELLIPHCTLVTPNLPEAEFFLGRKLTSLEMVKGAALQLSEKWQCGVLVKGGHLEGDPVDVLVYGGELNEFPHQRISMRTRIRGTGCSLSTAIAAGLAQGKNVSEAVESAITFIAKAIQNAYCSSRSNEVGFLGFEE
ncbi:bifunctional hydroxymethylpyrimidine kinase/phosphomethylpyrimidine kinase [bacterium]|nr:bifunctional hydroxymethylpyrimidine kinase/phosphomethylpyrimidine kinase [bacterium]MBU1880964.1 bifunctional hydroxymethylpyrimidine kinase/phosphomethylpyrimidine kinase [bacterium]